MHLPSLSLLSIAAALAGTASASPAPKLPSMPDMADLKNSAMAHYNHNLLDSNPESDPEFKPKPTSTEFHASFATTFTQTASRAQAAAASPSSTFSAVAGSTCPPSRPSKQCCMSVSSLADDITGENGLGNVLPWAQGIQVSSVLGFQCESMSAKASEAKCLDTVECCEAPSQEVAEKQKAGEDALFKGGCMAFAKAWEWELKHETKASSSSAAAVSPSNAVSTPLASQTPAMRV